METQTVSLIFLDSESKDKFLLLSPLQKGTKKRLEIILSHGFNF